MIACVSVPYFAATVEWRDGGDMGPAGTGEAPGLVLGGQPLNEPVYSYGPFVMNTREQIQQCFKNYEAGLMGNPDLVNR